MARLELEMVQPGCCQVLRQRIFCLWSVLRQASKVSIIHAEFCEDTNAVGCNYLVNCKSAASKSHSWSHCNSVQALQLLAGQTSLWLRARHFESAVSSLHKVCSITFCFMFFKNVSAVVSTIHTSQSIYMQMHNAERTCHRLEKQWETTWNNCHLNQLNKGVSDCSSIPAPPVHEVTQLRPWSCERICCSWNRRFAGFTAVGIPPLMGSEWPKHVFMWMFPFIKITEPVVPLMPVLPVRWRNQESLFTELTRLLVPVRSWLSLANAPKRFQETHYVTFRHVPARLWRGTLRSSGIPGGTCSKAGICPAWQEFEVHTEHQTKGSQRESLH